MDSLMDSLEKHEQPTKETSTTKTEVTTKKEETTKKGFPVSWRCHASGSESTF